MKLTGKQFFQELKTIKNIQDEIFSLWKKKETLKITPRFFAVAKELGLEYARRFNESPKIEVLNNNPKPKKLKNNLTI